MVSLAISLAKIQGRTAATPVPSCFYVSAISTVFTTDRSDWSGLTCLWHRKRRERRRRLIRTHQREPFPTLPFSGYLVVLCEFSLARLKNNLWILRSLINHLHHFSLKSSEYNYLNIYSLNDWLERRQSLFFFKFYTKCKNVVLNSLDRSVDSSNTLYHFSLSN